MGGTYRRLGQAITASAREHASKDGLRCERRHPGSSGFDCEGELSRARERVLRRGKGHGACKGEVGEEQAPGSAGERVGGEELRLDGTDRAADAAILCDPSNSAVAARGWGGLERL